MVQVYESKKFLDLAEQGYSVHPKSSIDEILVQQALFRSAILAYGKCFGEHGMDRSSLDKNKVFGRKHSLIDTHNRLIDLRHKFAAHNDNSGLDEAVVGVQEYGNEFVIENRYAIANPLNEYDDYRHVIAAVEDFVVIQTNKALGSLEKRLGKKIRVRNASQECPQAAV